MIYIILGLVVVSLLYVWLGSPLGTSDRVGITTAISTVALAIYTSIYAWYTRKMANEINEQAHTTMEQVEITRKQAEANIKMAESMTRPYVLLRLDVMNDEALELKKHLLPEELKILVMNAVSGPAINLEAFFWSQKSKSPSTTKGYLAQNEHWQASIMELDMGIKNESTILDSVQSELIGKDITYAIVVDYEDIHKRKLTSYLTLEIVDNMYVFDGEQNIMERNI